MRNELGYTGDILQRELLGAVNKEEEKKFLQSIKDSYLNFRKSIDLVKRCQEDESVKPKPEFARELRNRLIEMLQLEDPKKLKFFTAVNSYLDHKHGVDAFVELETKNGRILRVTFDCTMNVNKGEDGKADVVFLVPSDGIDRKADKKQFDEIVDDVARRTFEILEQQMKGAYH